MRSKLVMGLVAALAVASAGCKSKNASDAPSAVAEKPAVAEAPAPAPSPAKPGAAVAGQGQPAKLGQPAPDFSLTDLDGKPFKLSEHRGKTVVLEWFNPDCPFVKASHTKGSLVDLAERQQKQGVVWVAINSNRPGSQGEGAERNQDAKREFKLSHPILLDPSGQVGKLYGAERTPHMYVIDPKGVLVYAGAIDNSPDGEGESPKDGKLVNYVEQALSAVAAGKAVEPAETEAYGCTVKYGT